MENGDKQRIISSLGYYGAMFAFGMTSTALGPVLPSLADQTQSDLSQISMLFLLRGVGFFMGSILGGWIFDRLSGHPVIAGLLLFLATANALIPSIRQLSILAAVLFLIGMALNAINVGANTLLVWVNQKKVGPWLNGLHFCFGLGGFISPMIVTLVLTYTGGVTWAFWMFAFLVLLPTGVLFSSKSPTIQVKTSDLEGHRGIYRQIIPFALILFFYVSGEMSFSGWIYTYGLSFHADAIEAAGYLTAVFYGFLTLGRLIGIPISTWIRPRTILLVDFCGSLISVALIFVGSSSLLLLFIGTVGAGLFMGSTFPTMLAFAENRVRITGQVNGLFFASTSLGAMFFPWLTGQVYGPAGPNITMVIIFACHLCALGIYVATVSVGEIRRVPVR